MKRSATIASIIVLLALVGCDETKPPTAPATQVSASGTPATTQVQRAECVVCVGHEIDVLPDTPRADHEGKMYYFCSAGCKEVFAASPAKYLAQTTTQPTTAP